MKSIIFTAGLILSGVMNSAVAAEEPQVLNLGIEGGQNSTQQIGDNMCVKTWLDKTLNVDTQLRNSPDYDGIIQGLLGKKIDVVISMSPAGFASVYLQNPHAVEVFGIQEDDNDQSRGYHSVVIVQADSPYKKLEDLKGKRFGVGDPNSTSGFLAPDHSFKKLFGGNMDNQYNHTFAIVTFSGGHEQSILGMINNQFDGAVTWSSMVGKPEEGYSGSAFRRVMRAGVPDVMNKVRIIWESPLIPNGPYLIRSDLPAGFKQRVIDALHKLDKEDHECFKKANGGSYHIGKATLADYQDFIDMRKDLSKDSRG